MWQFHSLPFLAAGDRTHGNTQGKLPTPPRPQGREGAAQERHERYLLMRGAAPPRSCGAHSDALNITLLVAREAE
jgi:hypothetical protein